MSKNRWKYFAAKRRREQKLLDFTTMYGPVASPSWAHTPTGRVTLNTTRRPSPVWQALSSMDQSLEHADYSAIEQRILATMSMSRDRVRFVIQPYGADNATRAAFCSAFAVTFPSAPMGQNVTVICRPSQFARFLIYSNDAGGRNLFKELEPTLFTPQPKIAELDVSGNPAS